VERKVKKLSDLGTTQYGCTPSSTEEQVGPKLLRVAGVNKRNQMKEGSVPCRARSGEDESRSARKVSGIIVARMANLRKPANGLQYGFSDCMLSSTPRDCICCQPLPPLSMVSRNQTHMPIVRRGTVSRSSRANMNTVPIVSVGRAVLTFSTMQPWLQRISPLRKRTATNLCESPGLAALRDEPPLTPVTGELQAGNVKQLLKECTP